MRATAGFDADRPDPSSIGKKHLDRYAVYFRVYGSLQPRFLLADRPSDPRETVMGLRCVVLVKQVPDTKNVTGEAMKEDGTVNRAALPAVFNPEDLNALEEALRLRDRFGGRVSVITMGPPAAVEVLRESLYRGADEVVLLTDRAFAGADTLATSYTLALAVRKLGKVDLVLCGRQAIDGDTAQVGPQTAEKLGLPQITGITRVDAVDLGKRTITATRAVEGGSETVRSGLPALLTVTGEANDPRPPSVKLVMTYKSVLAETLPEYDDSYLDPESDEAQVCMIDRNGRPVCRAKVVQWDHLALDADRELVGLRGSPTRVKKIDSVVLAQGETRLVEASDEGISGLVHELIEEHILG
jgi:electron transfer flavoprotein beta subunit